MSVQLQLRSDTAANWASVTPAVGEAICIIDQKRLAVGDGATAGGNALAKLSEVPVAPSAHGATAALEWIEQLVTCSGATTAIPLGATVVIYAVALRVVTAVTGCTSITINDSQNGNGHWGSGIGISAGSTNPGGATPGPYYNGTTTLALAAVGGAASFSGGTVRVSVLAMVVGPPTS